MAPGSWPSAFAHAWPSLRIGPVRPHASLGACVATPAQAPARLPGDAKAAATPRAKQLGIIVAGGVRAGLMLREVEFFDFSSQRWSWMPSLDAPRMAATLVPLGGDPSDESVRRVCALESRRVAMVGGVTARGSAQQECGALGETMPIDGRAPWCGSSTVPSHSILNGVAIAQCSSLTLRAHAWGWLGHCQAPDACTTRVRAPTLRLRTQRGSGTAHSWWIRQQRPPWLAPPMSQYVRTGSTRACMREGLSLSAACDGSAV